MEQTPQDSSSPSLSTELPTEGLFYLASELEGDVAATQRRLEEKRQRLVAAGILLPSLESWGEGERDWRRIFLLAEPGDNYPGDGGTGAGGGTPCPPDGCPETA